MAEKLLEIENYMLFYETDEAVVYAVNGLDLTINKGETLGLVGETGAGKTTTALSIMKLLPFKTGFIKNGKITLGDIDITNATEQDMRLLRGKYYFNDISRSYDKSQSYFNCWISNAK